MNYFYENDFEIINDENDFIFNKNQEKPMNRDNDKKDYYEYNLIYDNDKDNLCFKETDIICMYLFNRIKLMLKSII